MNRSRALRIVFLLILLGAALASIDFGTVATHLDAGYLVGFAASQPVILMSLLFVAFRFGILASAPGEPPVPFAAALKAVALGVGLAIALPSKGSELIKITYLKRSGLARGRVGLAALITERTMDLALVGAMTLLTVGALFEESNPPLFIALAAVAAGVIVLLPVTEPILLKIAANLPWRRGQEFAHGFVEQAAVNLRGGRLVRAIGIGVMAWTFSIGGFWAFLHYAGDIPLTPWQVLTVFVAATIGLAVPLTPAGIGTFEAAVVFVLGRYGYEFEAAVALAIALHVSQMVVPLLIALSVAAREELGISNMLAEWRKTREGKRA